MRRITTAFSHLIEIIPKKQKENECVIQASMLQGGPLAILELPNNVPTTIPQH